MRSLAVAVVSFLLTVTSFAQESTSAVPNLVRYSGTISSAGQASASRTVGVTFALYKQQEGGAPVWQEVQNVVLSAGGHYSVLLGSASPAGLPADLFSPQEQRWLGVQVEGQPEQPRVLLVSVPYALKAAEADTLAGHSASEFVTTTTLQSAVKEQLQQQSAAPAKSSSALITAAGPQPNGPSAYIDNGTTLQTGASFNIDGTGTAANLNAVSVYQLNGAPLLSVSGYLSQSLGLYAGQGNTGNLNTFAGFYAGSANTTGAFNTVVGAQANNANQTGSYNTIVGAWAGLNNTGTNNAFYGAYAGYSNTTGVNNMFFGTNAGNKNTTGNGNFFLGAGSGYNNTSGTNNTFLGYLSGQNADATASNNLYIASLGAAGESGTTRIGDPAKQSAAYVAGIYGNAPASALPVVVNSNGQLGTTTAGIGVTSFKGRSGAVVPAANDYSFSQLSGTLGSSQFSGSYSNPLTFSNTSNVYYGDGSHLMGITAGAGSTYYIQNGTTQQPTSNFNISGSGAANSFSSLTNYQLSGAVILSTGSPFGVYANLFVGSLAGASNTINQGIFNTFVGEYAGYSNTGGQANTFSGYQAGYSNTTGSLNAFVGTWAGYQNTTGSQNVFTGYAGSSNTTGSYNVFSGARAGYSNTTGSYNTFSGYQAGYSNTGDNLGQNDGSTNSFYGAYAGYSNTLGQQNTFSGYQAGYSNTTGSNNTFLGNAAGIGIVTGNNDVYIANLGFTESNTIRIGGDTGYGPQTAAYIAGIYGANIGSGTTVYVNSNGQLGTSTSSRRFKEQIHDMGDSTNGLMKLRPVTYLYKPEYDKGPRTLQYGLIAEEVAEVYPDLVVYEPDGQPYTVKYQYLAPMLLNELQKQQAVIEKQQALIETQQQQVSEMRERLSRLESLLLQPAK